MPLHLNLVLHGAFIIIQSSSGIEIVAPPALDSSGLEQHVYKLGFYGQEKNLGRGPYTLQGLTNPDAPQYFSEQYNILFHRKVGVGESGAHTLINIPQLPQLIAPQRVLPPGSVAFTGKDAPDASKKTLSLVDVLVFDVDQTSNVALVDDAGRPFWSATEAGPIGNSVTVHLFAAPPDDLGLPHVMGSFTQMIALTDLDLALMVVNNTVPDPKDPGVEGVSVMDLWSLGERLHCGPQHARSKKKAPKNANKAINTVHPDDCLKIVIGPPQ